MAKKDKIKAKKEKAVKADAKAKKKKVKAELVVKAEPKAEQAVIREAPREPKKPVRGTLIEDRVVITDDYEEALEHYDRGCFGVLSGVKKKQIEMSLVEALYLFEREKLIVLDTNCKELTFEQVLDYAKQYEKTFWTRWRVYRNFRTRGYILKSALKFGADFLVYRRGMKPGEDHAKWVLYCVSESDGETWRNFSAKMRVAHSTRKKLLIGCVDDWGDVTFWEIRWCKP